MLASKRRRRLRCALGVTVLAAGGLTLALAGAAPWQGGPAHAVAATGSGEPTPQADGSVPVPKVTLIGASPREAPGETWGLGEVEGGGAFSATLVRYTSEGGWSLA